MTGSKTGTGSIGKSKGNTKSKRESGTSLMETLIVMVLTINKKENTLRNKENRLRVDYNRIGKPSNKEVVNMQK